MCVDLSATPFYIKGSGYAEGQPFPWLVSDFGLVDAIESGIVKIPRLPVKDSAEHKDEVGRPDPKYFRLWYKDRQRPQAQREVRQRHAKAGALLPGGRRRPEADRRPIAAEVRADPGSHARPGAHPARSDRRLRQHGNR
jgi:type III restriction enzyme